MTRGLSIRTIIERTGDGIELDDSEIGWLINEYVRDEIPDERMTDWLRAVCARGLTARESYALTRAMAESGETLQWALDRPTVDKHSTGGVGDKTTLVLVPLMAAAGLAFVKMSGRGLGHTGGTIDKLEAIPGFRTALPIDEIQRQVRRIGCALVSQTADLVPADRRLYALRDATGTVASTPLIAASIMSKKLAAGAQSIVLDVKWGRGAFVETREEARELARAMIDIGVRDGRRVRAVLSPMDAPLGRAVGNALEVREAIDALRGGGPADLWALTLALGTELLSMAHGTSKAEAEAQLTRLRADGTALDYLRTLISAQDGAPEVTEEPSTYLPRADRMHPVLFRGEAGWVEGIDARRIAEVALDLGAGRRETGDEIDLSVGVVLRARIGDRLEPGDAIAELHSKNGADLDRLSESLRKAYSWSQEPVTRPVPELEVVAQT